MLKIAASLFAAGAVVMSAAPASAVITTFATFSPHTTAANFRLVNSGNSSLASRTTDATLYSTSTASATVPGSVLVRFSFLEPLIETSVSNVNALFTYNATIARGTPASSLGSLLLQPGITGSFSFLTTSPITVSGPGLITHTYAAGSDLLSGKFTDATLLGKGSAASTSSSTEDGSDVVFTSDFLDFTDTSERDRGLTLTAIFPGLSKHTGLDGALKSFRATVGGQFSSDPAPIINDMAVPEPASWALTMLGFGMLGVTLRRKRDTLLQVA